MNAVDFFCGGGGMTKGLRNAGIQVLFGVDLNPACQATYENNNHIPYLNRDISQITGRQLLEEYPLLADNDNLLLVGCAPCQPFSSQRHSNHEHIAINLLDEFGRVVEELMPAHVLIENVPGIEQRGARVFNRFIDRLTRLGFDYEYRILNAKNFGVPQNRRRLILIASRTIIPVFPEATHGDGLLPFVTVRDAIHAFPAIEAGQTNEEVANHRAAGLSATNLRRIIATPHDGGGRVDWPANLVLDCHANGHTGHTDVYGRMAWNNVSPTLTSKCFSISNGRFGHPEQNRAISLREAAALQSFPDDYVFEGSMQEIGKQIGNAVPVLLAQRIGESLLAAHNEYQQAHHPID